ncbi:hypothetical protein [Salinarimonas rosea]|uniref:hypothetical protein n=1 Tax=Salinarimonas rosea TaxID=552063 RepID=UPI000421A4F6|nr:hypothetical protein [Salinarimonas rosea]
MPALPLFAHWLDVATSPLVLIAPLVLALASGRRSVVRLGTTLVALVPSAFSALGEPLAEATTLLALGALAGLVVAEIWLALALPVLVGIWRGLRRLFGGRRGPGPPP